MTDITDQIKAAKAATVGMSVLSTEVKDRALEAMAVALDGSRSTILEENRKDLDEARDKIPKPMYKRMVVDDAKIDDMVKGIRSVESLKDPVGGTMSTIELDDGLTLYQVSCPVGMLGVVFESRPDVVPQIMSLCLKSGNCVAFKGGSEAHRTIKAIFDVLRKAAATAGVSDSAFVLLESREDFREILDMDGYIDLLIPRGSNSFVKYVQENTRIPVLGHAAGICHIYVDSECDQSMAVEVATDSKVQYPAVCNAVENILVDSEIAEEFLPKLASPLTEKGVEIRGDDRVRSIVKEAVQATEDDWYEEYGDLIVAVKVVDSLQEAIDFINSHSSHHTDAIITSNMQKASVFVKMVDSADVFVNASTRFADGYRFGKGAEVGISTNKIHARGPMGMEGLMIYKYVLIGNGQVVKDYVGRDAKPFTHKRLDSECPLR
ncbi:MAG: glutamate-5-semialdehyde dehydrogenase [Candidatus Methanomethylophilaceae archaeon]|nr:glutamate-5-semialdehyde dehydrogenase [Candidatus Methanomethylophilaceae archaeon]